MSKSTRGNEFRKVDVDAYDEDNFQDEDLQAGGDEGQAVDSRASKVRELVSSKDLTKALKAAVQDPPQTIKNEAVKRKNFETVMDVISAFSATRGDSEINKAVESLSQEECDVLMKYIYRGMAEPKEEYSAQLLVFHKHASAHGGVGSIVRVLTDRKTV